MLQIFMFSDLESQCHCMFLLCASQLMLLKDTAAWDVQTDRAVKSELLKRLYFAVKEVI